MTFPIPNFICLLRNSPTAGLCAEVFLQLEWKIRRIYLSFVENYLILNYWSKTDYNLRQKFINEKAQRKTDPYVSRKIRCDNS